GGVAAQVGLGRRLAVERREDLPLEERPDPRLELLAVRAAALLRRARDQDLRRELGPRLGGGLGLVARHPSPGDGPGPGGPRQGLPQEHPPTRPAHLTRTRSQARVPWTHRRFSSNDRTKGAGILARGSD